MNTIVHQVSAVITANGRYFNASGKVSFVHISKCAGATFIRLLKAASLDVYPASEAGNEHSAWYQHNVACKYADYHMVALRSPRHHAWSLFAECKYDDWGMRATKNTNFPRSGNKEGNDVFDFDMWLVNFLPMGPEAVGSKDYAGKDCFYHCYHPANYQSRALTSHSVSPHGVDNDQFTPNITLAKDTYRGFDFVALADFVHESRCLLYYRLGNSVLTNTASYLNDACRCHNQSNFSDVHVVHHAQGHRSMLRDLPPQTLAKIESLTEIDTEIYTMALLEFLASIVWLESEVVLGRRVMCDNVLEKWEPELGYLNLNVTKLYYDAKRATSTPSGMD